MRITDDAGRVPPWDGKTFGRLKVRGPAGQGLFLKEDSRILTRRFLQIPAMSPPSTVTAGYADHRPLEGCHQVGRRVIPTISENLAVGHPRGKVAGIGARHPKWDERPLLVIALKEGQSATQAEIPRLLDGKAPSGGCRTTSSVSAIPHTATGKIQKTALRDQFMDYVLPTAVAAE
jgi:fatty-acyl-CoA synthase